MTLLGQITSGPLFAPCAEFQPFPICKHNCSASDLIIAVASLMPFWLCHVFIVGEVVAFVEEADELWFVSPGGRLLFASNTAEFAQQCFHSRVTLYFLR